MDKTAKKLTANGRDHIKGKNFALPGDRYPIHDASHARSALSMVAQHGSSAEKATVRAAVHSKYPGIGKTAAKFTEKQKMKRSTTGRDILSGLGIATLSNIGSAAMYGKAGDSFANNFTKKTVAKSLVKGTTGTALALLGMAGLNHALKASARADNRAFTDSERKALALLIAPKQ